MTAAPRGCHALVASARRRSSAGASASGSGSLCTLPSAPPPPPPLSPLPHRLCHRRRRATATHSARGLDLCARVFGFSAFDPRPLRPRAGLGIGAVISTCDFFSLFTLTLFAFDVRFRRGPLCPLILLSRLSASTCATLACVRLSADAFGVSAGDFVSGRASLRCCRFARSAGGGCGWSFWPPQQQRLRQCTCSRRDRRLCRRHRRVHLSHPQGRCSCRR